MFCTIVHSPRLNRITHLVRYGSKKTNLHLTICKGGPSGGNVYMLYKETQQFYSATISYSTPTKSLRLLGVPDSLNRCLIGLFLIIFPIVRHCKRMTLFSRTRKKNITMKILNYLRYTSTFYLNLIKKGRDFRSTPA